MVAMGLGASATVGGEGCCAGGCVTRALMKKPIITSAAMASRGFT